MASASVKLKKADAPTYVEYFVTLPTWEDLTSRIAETFHIPKQDIAVGYLDKAEDSVTLTHNQGLQEYYKYLDQSSQIKFVVLDRQAPDRASPSVGPHPPPSLSLIQLELQSFPLGLRISICIQLRLFCWVLNTSETEYFEVNVGKEKTVDGLKKKLKQDQAHTFSGIDSGALRLWKLSPPIPHADDVTLKGVENPEEVMGCIKLKPGDHIKTHFPSPSPDHIHILVQLPTLSRKRSRTLEEDRASKKIRTADEEEFPANIYIPREVTVSALYQKLKQRRWIRVRGTPGSGKSVLAALLRDYVNEKEPNTQVVLIDTWPNEQLVKTIPNTLLILDEAQTTYWDKAFWSRFKNPGFQNMRVVAFASHGSSGYTGPDNVTPLWTRMEQRVGLTRLDCGDGIVVGLLLTRDELNAFVRLRFHNKGFSDSFIDCIHDMTNGHVGACEDLLHRIIAHDSYRHRVKAAEYTYDMFIAGVPMTYIFQSMYRQSVFARGLPDVDSDLRHNPNITALFSEAIRKECIVFPEKYLASDPKDDDNRQAALRKIFRSGWFHTDIRADIMGVLYTFASPLHRRCIDWMVNGLPPESRITESNPLEFALAVIKKFSRQSLDKHKIGPKAQSIPEAQFQDEFYFASSKHANGSVSFPEFGTKKGRIDFFIRSKKWGIELLRDGNRLGQHAKRFTEGEYAKWIEGGRMSDYIIIDFRTRRPSIVHQDVDKLIYIVSVDDWKTVEVIDNKGRATGPYCLLNNS